MTKKFFINHPAVKRIALLACSLMIVFSGHVWAQQQANQQNQPTTIILMRHAEKVADGSKDPQLSEEGHERARAFARMFSLLRPDAIYSSNYQRTISTAKPLAEQKDLSIQIYEPAEQNAFLDKVVQDHQGGTVVIIGHSNSIPLAVNYLLKQDFLEELPETEYEKVFIVNLLPDGKSKLLPLLLEL